MGRRGYSNATKKNNLGIENVLPLQHKKYSMTETRKKITFSISPEVIAALKVGAKVDGRNLSRYTEAIIADFLKVKPTPIKKPVKPT